MSIGGPHEVLPSHGTAEAAECLRVGAHGLLGLTLRLATEEIQRDEFVQRRGCVHARHGRSLPA